MKEKDQNTPRTHARASGRAGRPCHGGASGACVRNRVAPRARATRPCAALATSMCAVTLMVASTSQMATVSSAAMA